MSRKQTNRKMARETMLTALAADNTIDKIVYKQLSKLYAYGNMAAGRIMQCDNDIHETGISKNDIKQTMLLYLIEQTFGAWCYNYNTQKLTFNDSQIAKTFWTITGRVLRQMLQKHENQCVIEIDDNMVNIDRMTELSYFMDFDRVTAWDDYNDFVAWLKSNTQVRTVDAMTRLVSEMLNGVNIRDCNTGSKNNYALYKRLKNAWRKFQNSEYGAHITFHNDLPIKSDCNNGKIEHKFDKNVYKKRDPKQPTTQPAMALGTHIRGCNVVVYNNNTYAIRYNGTTVMDGTLTI